MKKRNSLFLLMLVMVFGVVASCSETKQTAMLCASDQKHATIQSPDRSATAAVGLINDRAILANLEKIASKLIDDDKVINNKKLKQGLLVDSCKINLPKAHQAKLTPSEIYSQCKKGVIIVSGVYKCGKCSRWHPSPASGYFITEDGIFVTNYHVVNNDRNKTLVVMTDDGRVFPVGKVLAANKADDVAICKVIAPKGTKFNALPLSTDAPTGSAVSVISHPNRSFYVFTRGYVSRYFQASVKRGQKPITSIYITADYAKGSSGAPLFNDRGNVIGMVRATNSVYYNVKDGHKDNLQMVFKTSVPAQSILNLIQ